MSPTIRFFTTLSLFLSLGFTIISGVHAELIKGRGYAVLLNPQPTASGSKIEVLEFFYYGCPACNNLNRHLKIWLEKIPEDVSFKFIPAVLEGRSAWSPAAKTFYTLEVLGKGNELHDRIYDAIHIEKINPRNIEELKNWVVKQGIDRKKFVDVYNSFSVSSKTSQSVHMNTKYGLNGVPSFIVDGKYMVSLVAGETAQDTIKRLDQVIKKARKERTKK